MPFYDKRIKMWRGRIYKPDGRAETKAHARKSDAIAWEVARRAHWKAWRTRTGTGCWTLLGACTQYLNWVKVRYHPTTFSDKRLALRELVALFDPAAELEELETAAPEILEKIILKPGRSPQLANKRRKDLGAFCKYARRFFGLDRNPMEAIEPMPVGERQLQAVPTRQEFLALLAAASRQDRNLLTVWAGTGPRKSEILRITWAADIDLEDNRIRYGTRKTRSGNWRFRWVPFGPEVREALEDQLRIHLPQSEYVFQNRDERSPYYGDRYTARRRFMAGLCKTAKIERPIRSHSLRRYYASLLIEEGTDLETVRDLLGHGDVSVTARYVYRLREDLRTKAACRIRLGGGSPAGRQPGASRKPGRGQVVRLVTKTANN